MDKRQTLQAKLSDYSMRASHWLAEGNQASERGNHRRAERCYEKSQFWHDRATTTEEKTWSLKK